MKKPRIYISGPISGQDTLKCFEAFGRAEEILKAQGYEVFNPLNNGLPFDAATSRHMQRDLAELTREDDPYDAIYMMEKWNHSAGCWTEFHVACAIGLHVYFEQAGSMIKII